MAIGFILIGWIVGLVSALTGAIGFDMSLLATFGLFVGCSVLCSFLSIVYVAWRTGCFAGGSTPPLSAPLAHMADTS